MGPGKMDENREGGRAQRPESGTLNDWTGYFDWPRGFGER